jgi:hypothetical protein
MLKARRECKRENMKQTRNVSTYILAWSLWGISSAAGVLVLFWPFRDAVRAIAEALTMGARHGTSAQQFQVPYTLAAVDRVTVVVFGLLSVLLVVGVEHYYRTGAEEAQLARRFVQVTAVEFGVLFAALAIQSVYLGVLGLFTIWSVVVPLGVLAVTVALSWLLTRMRKKPSIA